MAAKIGILYNQKATFVVAKCSAKVRIIHVRTKLLFKLDFAILHGGRIGLFNNRNVRIRVGDRQPNVENNK